MRILIVEENPSSLRNLAEFLRQQTAAAVSVAATAAEAVETGRRERPDCLITEVYFEGASDDGFTIRDALRAELPGLRVAFLSTRPLATFEEEVGGDAVFYYPPFDGESLLRWVGGSEPAGDGSDNPTAPDPLEPGDQVGDYRLIARRRVRTNVIVYQALQESIQRRVALELLKPELTENEDAVREFRATVRAKASVIHPHVAPVYEAREEGGLIFYTRELISGKSLAQLIRRGAVLKQDTLLNIAVVAAEAYEYIVAHDVPTSPLRPESLFLGTDNQPRITNLAVAEPDPAQSVSADLRVLGSALARLADPASLAHDEIRQLTSVLLADDYGLSGQHQPITTWTDLRAAATATQQRLSDARSLRRPGQKGLLPGDPFARWRRGDRARTRRKALRRGTAVLVAVLLAVLAAAAFLKISSSSRSNPSYLAGMAHVPGGSFIYQEGERIRLDRFWISEYEVTIGQYAEFLAALDDSPDARFAHPDQPPSKGDHVPDDWEEIVSAAGRGGDFRGQPLTLDHPIFSVDWWDAHAFAAWRGHRLPTEQEWEKAARGRNGRLYPWGNSFVPGFANTAAPDEGSTSYEFWSPVDQFPEDRSEYYCFGTAGNVSEWTASWARHPRLPDQRVPVVRGGSFATPPEDCQVTTRLLVDSASQRGLMIGFRTASDTLQGTSTIR
ncbi:hypothetical protein BH23VER1_BH23VER1_35700 [soil metagenome]